MVETATWGQCGWGHDGQRRSLGLAVPLDYIPSVENGNGRQGARSYFACRSLAVLRNGNLGRVSGYSGLRLFCAGYGRDLGRSSATPTMTRENLADTRYNQLVDASELGASATKPNFLTHAIGLKHSLVRLGNCHQCISIPTLDPV